MSDDKGRPIIRQTRHSDEIYYIPARRKVHIGEGDWDRWIRSIASIPEKRKWFRDVAFATLGISIESFISFLFIGFSTDWLLTWPLSIYLAIGIGLLLVSIISFLADSREEQTTQVSVDYILRDMKDVRERATISEEQPRSQSKAVSIG